MPGKRNWLGSWGHTQVFPHLVTATERSHLVARESKGKATRKTLWIRAIHRESQSLACPPEAVPEAPSQTGLCCYSGTQNREAELGPRLGRAAPPPKAGAQPLPQAASTSQQSASPTETPQHSWSQGRGAGATRSQTGRNTISVYKILHIFWKCDPALPMLRTQSSSKLLPL